jgi:hypothetical protein
MRYVPLLVIALIIVIVLLGVFYLGITKDFILGILLGLVTSATVGLKLALDQFSSSVAHYRVKKTAEATKEIFDKPKSERSSLRDRYRYSLGVIIDELEQTFGKNYDFGKVEEWPCLTDYDEKKHQFDGDRWNRFNKYVRPVIEDVNSSSFVGKYRLIRYFSEDLRQLNALTIFCNCLENIVSELDAAIEAKLIELNDNNRIIPQSSTNSGTGSIQRLNKEYQHLHAAWCEWLRVAGILG